MTYPNITDMRKLSTVYQAVIRCKKCTAQFRRVFTQEDAGIKYKFKAMEIAERYAMKEYPAYCKKCTERYEYKKQGK